MKKIRFVFLLFTFILGLSIASNAATITFNDFSDVSSLQFNEDAKQEGNVLRLTPAESEKKGSVFLKDPISVGSFSTSFTFYLHDKYGWFPAADGFTFVLQSVGNDALGNGGGSLGYAGISNSIAVEFDTYQNSFKDKDDHIGIDVNGSVASVKTTGSLGSSALYGKNKYVWIDYNNNGDGMLYVYLSDSNSKPNTPILSHKLGDLKQYGLDPNNVYVGFTAATGLYYEAHDILSWTFTYDEPSAAVPLPNTLWLLAPTLFSLIGLKRKIVEI